MKGLVEFARDALGLELYPGQVEVLREWAASARRKTLWCLGRRSGKGLMAQVAAIYNAVIEVYPVVLSGRYIIVVATEAKQAEEFIKGVRTLLENSIDPDLAALVDWERCTLSQIVFHTGTVIRAMPCSSRSTRGLAISLLILDEAGHLQTDTEGMGAGKQVYQALAPSVAQFGDKGYIMLTSTPHWRSGLFWEQYRNGEDGLDPELLILKRPTWEMNPTITRESLEPEFRVDPDGAATEYGADFTAAEGAFIDILDILACKRDEGILAPDSRNRYSAAIDPAFQKDAFALTIGHRDDQRAIVDGVWVWVRQGYDNTLDQVTRILTAYSVKRVRTDQYSSQPVIEGLEKRGIDCEAVPWDNANKFEAFSKLKAGLVTRGIELPNDDLVVQELMNLEAKPTLTGMVRIAASAGNHDDRAVVLAALMDQLYGAKGVLVMTASYDPDHGDSADPFAQFDDHDDDAA